MSLSEKLERAVDRDPWKALAILAFGLLATVGGGGVWVGWVQGQVATIDGRVSTLEAAAPKTFELAERTARIEEQTKSAGKALERIENKLDQKADK